MALTPGTRVGAYEITQQIGAGGMGEVYRATDTNLKRAVAIKVLPDTVAADPERLARFQREAEVLASLNHPSIAAIYGLERTASMTAIVMELVEGPTLADRIASGPIPLDETLPIAKQIAEALEAAHEQGIIHRDLKPANIKLTSDDRTKVLDFGLAKMLDSAAASEALTKSPTLSIQATKAGVILGTVAYMSPEQARGKPVDRRTDIWSFGCILFEMLTGIQAFDPGETVSDAIASVLTRDADWNALPANTPAHIRILLLRCLQKDPKRRLPHIGVARLEIDEPVPSVPIQQTAGAVAFSRARTAALWAIPAALVIAAAVARPALLSRRERISSPAVRFVFGAPEGMRLGTNVAQRGVGSPAAHYAPSPDGRRIAYVIHETAVDAKPRLWVRAIDAFDGHPLTGTEDASFPFWSPDSRFIAFFAGGKLKKVDVAAGSPQTICDAPRGEGGTWNRSDEILFAPAEAGPLFKVSSAGGLPMQVTNLDEAGGEISHIWPQFLPDDRHFLYLTRARGGQREEPPGVSRETSVGSIRLAIYAGDLDSAERVEILADTARAQYAAGHLLFTRGATLLAQPFDEGGLRLRGNAKPIAEDVPTNPTNGRTGFAVSDSLLLYRIGASLTLANTLAWYDRTGKRLGTVGGRAGYRTIRLSPDDKSVAAHIATTGRPNFLPRGDVPPSDLWIFDLTRAGISSRVTFTPDEMEDGIVWSPDAASIVFAAAPGGGPTTTLMLSHPGRVGEPEVLLKSPGTKRAWSWSPDGKYIAYYQASPKTSGDIWLLPLFGDRKPFVFVQTSFNEGGPMFSPDGRWIAYQSNRDGGAVYVRPFPANDREWRISQEGGAYPQWKRDGKELFFIDSSGSVMAATIKAGTTFDAEVPRKLIDATTSGLPASGPQLGLYSVSADGSRFLVIESGDSTGGDSAMAIAVDWLSALQ